MITQDLNLLTTKDFISILGLFDKLISDNVTELCKLDSICGDGDHGTTLNRGTAAAQNKITQGPNELVDKLLLTYTMSLLSSMGGASGPIFAALFRGMGLAAKDKSQVNKSELVDMFDEALKNIKKIGKAEEGEKTLIDSLSPAVHAARNKLDSDYELPEILAAAHEAALEGVINTRNMQAKKGRARYAGERGIGHEDAGSMSVALLFQAFSDYTKK